MRAMGCTGAVAVRVRRSLWVLLERLERRWPHDSTIEQSRFTDIVETADAQGSAGRRDAHAASDLAIRNAVSAPLGAGHRGSA